jgi:very-short-patch-repair endonuclease
MRRASRGSSEWKNNISVGLGKFYGSGRSKVVRKNSSRIATKTLKRLWKDPDYRRKMCKAATQNITNLNSTRRFRDHMSEVRAKNGRSHFKEYWSDPKNRPGRPSKIQISIFRALCRAGVRGLKLEYKAGTKSIDIAYLPTKTAVEIDGVYYHQGRSDGDRKRDRFLKKLGWRVIHVKLDRSSLSCVNIPRLVRRIYDR